MTAFVEANAPDLPEPPAGSPWDAPFAEAPRLLLDLETTGTDPADAFVCELAAIRLEGGRETGRCVTLVRPPGPVGDSASVHGITDAQLAEAPPLAACAERLERLLAGAVVVGHRVGFDLAFLDAAHRRGELPAPPVNALDTRALARRAWHRGGYGLAALSAEHGLPAPVHRAEADARASGALLEVLAKDLRVETPRQLWQAQRSGKPIRFRDDVARTLATAEGERRVARVAYRVPGRHPFVDELEVWTLIPPRVEGRLRGRGVRTLRGDRLLWAELTDARYTVPDTYRPTLVA